MTDEPMTVEELITEWNQVLHLRGKWPARDAVSITVRLPIDATIHHLRELATLRSQFTGLCSAHQMPDAACPICNPAVMRLEKELAALRETTSAMADLCNHIATAPDSQASAFIKHALEAVAAMATGQKPGENPVEALRAQLDKARAEVGRLRACIETTRIYVDGVLDCPNPKGALECVLTQLKKAEAARALGGEEPR